MWRRNPFQENSDSDQSISDEEEFIDVSRENCVSLSDRLEKEKQEGFQLQSRLETLKGKCDNNHSYNEEHGTLEHSIVEVHEDFSGEEENQARGKRVQATLRRSICSLGDSPIESEDLYEPFSGGTSSDDEAGCQNLELVIPEIKKHTISDKFQEALGSTSSLSAEGTSIPRLGVFSTGLFGKLHQVMQQENEIDMDFLTKLQIGATFKNEPSSITVKIVSRYLDAKLTVCYCAFVKIIEGFSQPESPKILENEGRKVTIIFYQRICANVDLEIGNLICIHPPWKEVDVTGNGEKVILSIYFSDFSV
ncbi:hypothetical protein like AT1G02960 [Hibiscus trionum]|uniref:Uncharacterized protein n=1 Tax=Hibiscus trionum TaxID=183268 RepID=A0A9W7HDF1_HIBTR|nr:hypothetical protein like AT1G02960 [Hibiscus trionum]